MCFSANASFVASAVLTTIGIVAVKKVKPRSQLLFAAIPLVFAFQQLTEGFLWLSFRYPAFADWQQPVTYVFLVIAQVIWPTWVPLSIFLLEKNKNRKKGLLAILIMGCITSTYLACSLVIYDVHAEIIGRHIHYQLDFLHSLVWLSGIFYFIPTVVPPLISSIRKMQLLGFIILASYIVTQLFFDVYVISVWCFFAALISVVVLFVIERSVPSK